MINTRRKRMLSRISLANQLCLRNTFGMFRPVIQHRYRLVRLFCLGLLAACSLAKPTATPMPTPDIPQIEILSPASNQQVLEGLDFDLDILASDSPAGIQQIELYVDEVLINTSRPASGPVPVFRVTMNWLARGIGFHKISAIAYRADDARSSEHVIILEVIPRS